tara:strand:+ start:601 stop:834 length:234 start_codon:yes stop_codon:yes gene_type:complete
MIIIDKSALMGSISSKTALIIPRELPKKYPIKNTINAREYLLHGLVAHKFKVFILSITYIWNLVVCGLITIFNKNLN